MMGKRNKVYLNSIKFKKLAKIGLFLIWEIKILFFMQYILIIFLSCQLLLDPSCSYSPKPQKLLREKIGLLFCIRPCVAP